MGVYGLSFLIRDASPDAILKAPTLNHYSGKVIAMDAQQHLYQAKMVNKKTKDDENNKPSSLLRIFYSCIKLLENQIKPIYVFDGKPPTLKAPVLKERQEKRQQAVVELKQAEEKGETTQINHFRNQTVKVKKVEVRSCQGLFKLMGIPFFYAPGEAEAQCAALVESGLVYASATQDMDALTYGTKVVLRHLPIFKFNHFIYPMEEIHLDKILERLQISMAEFIDLSIIMGCDYCTGIKHLGAHRALELIHQYHTIENIMDNVDRKQFCVPNGWLFKEAREQYLKPIVKDCDVQFKWNEPDYDGIVKYLEGENKFNESEIRRALKRLSI